MDLHVIFGAILIATKITQKWRKFPPAGRFVAKQITLGLWVPNSPKRPLGPPVTVHCLRLL